MKMNVSITYLACEHAKLKPPHQKRKKTKIPTESETETFFYAERLRLAVAGKVRLRSG